jgi:hypothetical protein
VGRGAASSSTQGTPQLVELRERLRPSFAKMERVGSVARERERESLKHMMRSNPSRAIAEAHPEGNDLRRSRAQHAPSPSHGSSITDCCVIQLRTCPTAQHTDDSFRVWIQNENESEFAAESGKADVPCLSLDLSCSVWLHKGNLDLN